MSCSDGDDDGYDYAPATCLEGDGDENDGDYDYASAVSLEGDDDDGDYYYAPVGDDDDRDYDYAPATWIYCSFSCSWSKQLQKEYKF